MKLKARSYNLKAIGGFTLIELLVVIAIISLLSSIVLASLSQARVKTRDSQRVQDLIQIRNAMELYYVANGHYPPTIDGTSPLGRDCWDCSSTDLDETRLLVLSPYLNPRPVDPTPTTGAYCGYWYLSNPPDFSEYKVTLFGKVEDVKNIPLIFLDDTFDNGVPEYYCPPADHSVSVSSSGAKCWGYTDVSRIVPC